MTYQFASRFRDAEFLKLRTGTFPINRVAVCSLHLEKNHSKGVELISMKAALNLCAVLAS